MEPVQIERIAPDQSPSKALESALRGAVSPFPQADDVFIGKDLEQNPVSVLRS